MERSFFDLNPTGRWVGTRVDLYRELDSTNRVASELAAAGAPEGTLVVADGQTAGRGRLGRTFFSPPGCSVYLSLVLRPELRAEFAHRYVFVASLAVADTISLHLPTTVPIEIKWPNDVLLDGRKTSGINLPVQFEADRIASLVLGIGVNVNLAREDLPPELESIATSLQMERGSPLDRLGFAEALLARLEAGIDHFRERGFDDVLDSWLKYFRMRGSRVRIGGPGVTREIEGLVEGVDRDGALRLRTASGSERILAGDVTILSREG